MESGDPLGLDPATMRRHGHQVVDMLVETLTDPQAPPLRRASAAEMRERLAEPAPDGPNPFTEVLERLEHDVLPTLAFLESAEPAPDGSAPTLGARAGPAERLPARA